MPALEGNASQKAILVALGVVATVGVLGAALAHENAAQVLGFCSLICVSLLTLLQQGRVAQIAEQAAVKVEQVKQSLSDANIKLDGGLRDVKQTLEDKTAKTDEKLDIIHALGNSKLEVEQRLVAELSRWKAERTGKPEDIAAAEAAEKALADHLAKQATFDAKASKETIRLPPS